MKLEEFRLAQAKYDEYKQYARRVDMLDAQQVGDIVVRGRGDVLFSGSEHVGTETAIKDLLKSRIEARMGVLAGQLAALGITIE